MQVYRFTAPANLPHNVMELSSRGGNTNLVYPVVEALARGTDVAQQARCVCSRCRVTASGAGFDDWPERRDALE